MIASEVPIVLGQKDDRAVTITLTTEIKQHKGTAFTELKDSETFKKMSDSQKEELMRYQKKTGKPIYIAIGEITKGSKSYQNVVNGVFSTKGDALVFRLKSNL